jgi:hypothetical protein
MTSDMHSHGGRAECIDMAKAAQCVLGLKTGIETTRQNI